MATRRTRVSMFVCALVSACLCGAAQAASLQAAPKMPFLGCNTRDFTSETGGSGGCSSVWYNVATQVYTVPVSYTVDKVYGSTYLQCVGTSKDNATSPPLHLDPQFAMICQPTGKWLIRGACDIRALTANIKSKGCSATYNDERTPPDAQAATLTLPGWTVVPVDTRVIVTCPNQGDNTAGTYSCSRQWGKKRAASQVKYLPYTP